MVRKKDCTSCANSIKLKTGKGFCWWICELHDYRIDNPDRYTCSDWKAIPYGSKFNKQTILNKINLREVSHEEKL